MDIRDLTTEQAQTVIEWLRENPTVTLDATMELIEAVGPIAKRDPEPIVIRGASSGKVLAQVPTANGKDSMADPYARTEPKVEPPQLPETKRDWRDELREKQALRALGKRSAQVVDPDWGDMIPLLTDLVPNKFWIHRPTGYVIRKCGRATYRLAMPALNRHCPDEQRETLREFGIESRVKAHPRWYYQLVIDAEQKQTWNGYLVELWQMVGLRSPAHGEE